VREIERIRTEISIQIIWDLATVTSCIDLFVRIVTKSPKLEPLLIFSISLDMNHESVRMLFMVAFWGHESTPVRHKHMLISPACISPLITEDLQWAGPQLVFTFDNWFSSPGLGYAVWDWDAPATKRVTA
jgi:hypothetical protein